MFFRQNSSKMIRSSWRQNVVPSKTTSPKDNSIRFLKLYNFKGYYILILTIHYNIPMTHFVVKKKFKNFFQLPHFTLWAIFIMIILHVVKKLNLIDCGFINKKFIFCQTLIQDFWMILVSSMHKNTFLKIPSKTHRQSIRLESTKTLSITWWRMGRPCLSGWWAFVWKSQKRFQTFSTIRSTQKKEEGNFQTKIICRLFLILTTNLFCTNEKTTHFLT